MKAQAKKRAAKKEFAVTEKNLDTHAKRMMHEPKCGSRIKPGDAVEDQGHARQGRPGHYTYI